MRDLNKMNGDVLEQDSAVDNENTNEELTWIPLEQSGINIDMPMDELLALINDSNEEVEKTLEN